MTISGISNNVQALLTNTDYFVTVLPAPPTKGADFDGYPAVSHYYADTQSDYATVSQNRRVIEYVVELYIISDKTTEEADKFTEAYTLIDNVIQMFDKSRDLSDQDASLTRACDIMRPTPSTLERITTDEGDGLMMTIRLFCEADISFIN